jgi:hypothetical protein
VRFAVDFVIEPKGREVEMDIDAASSKEAMIAALTQLEVGQDELLHTIYAHIGRPGKVLGESREKAMQELADQAQELNLGY